MDWTAPVWAGLSWIGLVHTGLAILALAVACSAILRDGELRFDRAAGQVYVLATLVVALTSFSIFNHGGPGPGHLLAGLTLVALIAAYAVWALGLLGSWSQALSRFALSATILFHLIPGITETLTRLPYGAPFAASPQDPVFKPIYGALLVAFVAFSIWQVIALRERR